MDVTHEMTCTLRAKANHPPCVMGASGFCTEHSANSRGIGYGAEESPTLRAGVVPGVAIEFNPTDSRIRVKEDGICQTLCSRMGTGGNNVPLVFGMSSDQSNAMLSDNPRSGIYEAKTSRTLDCSGGSPCCHQGGIKWLRHPNTDAAEYKAYGNSVAVPCVFFVLAGIAWAAGKEQSE